MKGRKIKQKKKRNDNPRKEQGYLSVLKRDFQVGSAVAACRASRAFLRLIRRGGTALPGKAAMLFCKDVLGTAAGGVESIVVVGTNGKTTTAAMIEHAMTLSGKKVLSNRSGANLLSGVTAEFVSSADWKGRQKYKYAVIECDEGALHQVVPLLKPKMIVVTNLFRDQLDRYGEVMHTLEAIRAGIREVPDAILCLNADDSLTASLALDFPNPIVRFGLDTPVGDQSGVEISDSRYCIRCGAEYRYNYYTYAHLGDFFCPECGYSRTKPDLAVTSIDNITANGSQVHMRFTTAAGAANDSAPGEAGKVSSVETEAGVSGEAWESVPVKIAAPAVYNVYNAAAAACACTAAGLERKYILEALAQFTGSFGRMETFELDGIRIQMILVKNPAGCNQALEYLCSLKEPYNAVLCLNDEDADGHDISWIWDVDYEKLCSDDALRKVYVWGERAEDLQLRLKYAGADESRIELVGEKETLIGKIRKSELPVYILPNYTSMLSLRDVLSRQAGKAEFWKGTA